MKLNLKRSILDASILDFSTGPLRARADNLSREDFKAQYICIYVSKRERPRRGYHDTDLMDGRGESAKKKDISDNRKTETFTYRRDQNFHVNLIQFFFNERNKSDQNRKMTLNFK